MSKLWLVASHEYKRHVFTRRFIFMLLSLPAGLALMIGLIVLATASENSGKALGYVDHAGLLADPILPPKRGGSPNDPPVPDLVPLIPYQSEEAARQALESKEIQAYYVVMSDYFETNKVELVYFKQPGKHVGRQFWDFMQINLLTDMPPGIASRAVADSNVIVRWPEGMPGGGREFSQETFVSTFMPLIIGGAFLFLLFMTSGYMMQAVVEEKENRTMEILMTTISPNQLLAGKVLGITAVGFTQLAGWVLFALLAVIIGGQVFGIGAFQHLSVDPLVIVEMLAIAIPGFVMIAALMTALGATVAEAQEAQQFTGLFVLPTMVPLWLAALMIEHPNSLLAIGLSLFPLTALSTFAIRLSFTPVPVWQLAVSIVILVACALGALWLAGRAFRLGMLRYGQRLSLRELLPTREVK